MYRDFGADDWFFEIDETDGAALWTKLDRIQRDRGKAKAQVRKIVATVSSQQRLMLAEVRAAASNQRS
jgi:hypothetical protein